MIRVSAITSGRNLPSSRFRIRQHIEPLRSLGVDVREHIPRIEKFAPLPLWTDRLSVRWAPHFYLWQAMKAASRVPGVAGSWAADITWLQREMLPARYSLERFLRAPLVFDVDDAIWLASRKSPAAVSAIARRSAMVLAGNGFLADWLGRYASEVRIVPTAIDTERFHPGPEPAADRFIIGWTGSRSSLPYLEGLEEPLRQFMARHPRAELLIVADEAPAFAALPPDRVRFLPWSPDVEAAALRDLHVGLMPLPDTDWARGKCSFKMLQYMSSGVPVIVSPVGMNAEVLELGEVGFAASTHAEWIEALEALAADGSAPRRMGRQGRRVIDERFSVRVVAHQIADAFAGLVDRS